MVFHLIKSGYKKVKEAFAKTKSLLGVKLRALFSQAIDADILDQLEQLFYEADLGVQTSRMLTEKIREIHQRNPQIGPEELIIDIRKEIISLLTTKNPTILQEPAPNEGPFVILIVGVNGNGKTTSVAKLAKRFQEEGKKVLIGAADTFRAAATEQLEIWAQRLGVDIVKGGAKSDPAAVAYDAIQAGISRKADVILIDTAGRLHTKTHLMQELDKIRRSSRKLLPNSPHETLLVLDATAGQNAIDQAATFNKYAPITGLILTKLDGSAKGGIIVQIQQQLGIPVKFIGVGESLNDLEPFSPEHFVEALFD